AACRLDAWHRRCHRLGPRGRPQPHPGRRLRRTPGQAAATRRDPAPVRRRQGPGRAAVSAPVARTWMDRVAHDLRGPLAPMQTAVYLLREPGIADAQRDELLAVLERQIQRLGGMIDEFSDLGRAGTGQLLVRREAIDVELLVSDTAS